jgi:hypothetical protein
MATPSSTLASTEFGRPWIHVAGAVAGLTVALIAGIVLDVFDKTTKDLYERPPSVERAGTGEIGDGWQSEGIAEHTVFLVESRYGAEAVEQAWLEAQRELERLGKPLLESSMWVVVIGPEGVPDALVGVSEALAEGALEVMQRKSMRYNIVDRRTH